MVRQRQVATLPSNLILLQNSVRRDPSSYYEEFLQQNHHYESLRDLLLMNPAEASRLDEFKDLIGFISAVCRCYPKETRNFPNELQAILLNNHRYLSPELREKIIQCLNMLRNKGVILAEFLMQTVFPLLIAYSGTTSTASGGQHVKALRRQIYGVLITLLKSVNSRSKDQKLNRSTQALLFNLLELRSAQGLWATKITRELWRRGIWDDPRTVEIMTQAALHDEKDVATSAVRFFLGADKERDENFDDDSSDEEGFDLRGIKHRLQINKKSTKRDKKVDQAMKTLKKKDSPKHSATYLNFSAIHLLRDPQGFAEKLFEKQLNGKNSSKFDLDQKIMLMNLISRLIGTHKLTVLGLYSFFLRYLTPKQRNVTQIMAAAAQASHDTISPEIIHPMVRKIADEFVSEGVATEVASAGINTIREILSRAPLAIDTPLLHDLTAYKSSKTKAVVMAARSLISLYRDVAPEMLPRKDRGKIASMGLQSGENRGLPKFGEQKPATTIPGIELLAKWRETQDLADDDFKEEDWNIPEQDSSEEEEGEWINLEQDDDLEIIKSDKRKDNSKKAEKEEASDNDMGDEEVIDEDDVEVPIDDNEEGDDGETSLVQDDKMEESNNSKDENRSEKKPSSEQEELVQARDKLLSTRLLTPADFKKLEELRVQHGIEKILGVKNSEEEVDSSGLIGPVKYKQRREDKIAKAQEGREGREFGSKKGKKDTPHSTTNKQKARKKNFMMVVHKRSVQGKQRMSLRDRQKSLRNHITKQKKKGF